MKNSHLFSSGISLTNIRSDDFLFSLWEEIIANKHVVILQLCMLSMMEKIVSQNVSSLSIIMMTLNFVK